MKPSEPQRDLPPTPEQVQHVLRMVASEYLSFLTGFATYLDGLHRWRAAAEGETAAHLDTLIRQAQGLMAQHGVRPIARVGAPLDLRFHRVVETEADPTRPKDAILRIPLPGYELNLPAGLPPMIVRQADVVVSTGPREPTP